MGSGEERSSNRNSQFSILNSQLPSASFVNPAALSLALLLVACSPSTPPSTDEVDGLPSPSNILLITIDTLRADHLSMYGYPRETSPVMDGLAGEGVRVERATVQWPKTAPSFASIFTATYPKDNKIVRRVGERLPDGLRMLAEELREHGYSTHAVVANGAVGSEFNFHQGFQSYKETWKIAPQSEGQDPNRAEMVTRLALETAAEIDPTRPFLLWVHYLDPHSPYTPPEPFSSHFQNDAFFDSEERIEIDETAERKDMGGIGVTQVLDGRDELAFYVARYDAEIAYTDHQVGVLLEGLEEKGLLGGTLTVVTSDHGESLGEHHYFFDHGRFGFQSNLDVPLIFHFPGVLSPRVVSGPVQLLDLAPTLLEAAGALPGDGVWMQGRSLFPQLLGLAPEPKGPRYAYSEAGYATEGRWQKIIRDSRYKLLFAPYDPDQRWIGGPGVEYTLYDLDADPGEETNLMQEQPEEFQRLKDALYAWYIPGVMDVLVDKDISQGEESLDERTLSQLRALGYIEDAETASKGTSRGDETEPSSTDRSATPAPPGDE